MELWPHQVRAIEQSRAMYRAGTNAWAIVAPPGAGKSRVMFSIAAPAAQAGKRVCIYSPRIAITRQLGEELAEGGSDYGIIGAGFEQQYNPSANIQICSLDTVFARMNRWDFEFPQADLVLVDEAHMMTASKARAVFDRHQKQGARRIGFTATPVDLGGFYEALVDAGSYTELLQCKAHATIEFYGPDAPDLSKIRTMPGGEFSEEDNRRVNSVPTIIGRVYDYWRKLNPQELPTVLFAPGVQESRFLLREFAKRGVECAHIDAERTMFARWNDSGTEIEITEEETTSDSRKEVAAGSKDGRYKIVTNRWIMREGLNWPWLRHCILATSFGSIASYLQATGRLLRYSKEYDKKVLVDHGGNLHRHGLANIDREWNLGDTAATIASAERERREKSKSDDAEPICCPQCCAYRMSGSSCQQCGFISRRGVRVVRQMDGTLRKVEGRDVQYKPPRPQKTFDDLYKSQLFASNILGHSVCQAYTIAAKKAEKEGIPVEIRHMKVPDRSSPDWRKSCREVYPQFKRSKG